MNVVRNLLNIFDNPHLRVHIEGFLCKTSYPYSITHLDASAVRLYSSRDYIKKGRLAAAVVSDNSYPVVTKDVVGEVVYVCYSVVAFGDIVYLDYLLAQS